MMMMMMNCYCSENMTKHIRRFDSDWITRNSVGGSGFRLEKHDKTLANRFDSDWGTIQNKIHRTTLNTAKVTLITRKPRHGIRQLLSKTSESKEERAVHKDVTKCPCTSTLVLINITTSTIEVSFLEVEGRPSIREVTNDNEAFGAFGAVFSATSCIRMCFSRQGK
jgi:hypothetical protein